MIDIASGHPAVDRYLAESYEQVRGMSSRFAAAICGHLIRRQSALGVGAPVAAPFGVCESELSRHPVKRIVELARLEPFKHLCRA